MAWGKYLLSVAKLVVFRSRSKDRNLPLLVCWGICLAINKILFQNSNINWNCIYTNIEALYTLIPQEVPRTRIRIITTEHIDKSYPWAYFDGSTQDVGCEEGAILYLSDHHHYKLKMGFARGTNNFVKLNSLRLLLTFAHEKNINCIHIFGDSTIVIDWFNSITHCHVHALRGLLDEIFALKTHFDYIVCSHIYRERNQISDGLSKEVAQQPSGQYIITEQHDQEVYHFYHRPFIEIAV